MESAKKRHTSEDPFTIAEFAQGFNLWCETHSNEDLLDTTFERNLRQLREEQPHLNPQEAMDELRRRMDWEPALSMAG